MVSEKNFDKFFFYSVLLDAAGSKSSAQQELYNSVVHPNPKLLSFLFKNPNTDKNHIYKYQETKQYNIFQILCATIMEYKEDKMFEYRILKNEFIACGHIILDSGVDIIYRDNIKEHRSIEFAVLTGEIELVQHIITIYEEQHRCYVIRDLFCTIIKFFSDSKAIDLEYLELMEFLIGSSISFLYFLSTISWIFKVVLPRARVI